MNLEQFNTIWGRLAPDALIQERTEWLGFLEFIETYFRNRGINNPLIVEIGAWRNAQKQFYVELFDAEHIGIDLLPDSHPDIVGNSQAPDTMKALLDRLAGYPIDLLFIDGDHSYEGVKADYTLYSPMVKHLIAFHDICLIRDWENPPPGILHLWRELTESELSNTFITFKKDTPPWQMGIGLIIKGST